MAKSFLKWPGGKSKLINRLSPHLSGKRLVEPFVGAGNVFLNLEFDEYLLCDINVDLINTYKVIAERKEAFIEDLRELFKDGNVEKVYYKRRNEFNMSDDVERKALLFVYLNRHGFNGLCRYSKRSGYNVPFGKYKSVYFPEEEILHFLTKSDKCTFKVQSYGDTFAEVTEDDAVYCDPPYLPVDADSFTNYSKEGFTINQQFGLAEFAKIAPTKVVISNSDCKASRRIYKSAMIIAFEVQRNISRDKVRKKAAELIAIFKPKKEKGS